MNKKRGLIIVLTLSTAGILVLASRESLISQPGTPGTSADGGDFDTRTQISTSLPTFEGCAFMWAYHEAPELTGRFDPEIRRLNPDASGNVSLFGEDCIYEDGHSTFSAMETNFYVRQPVENLMDHQAFGTWMYKVMPVIRKIPSVEIQGNIGFVEFWFVQDELHQLIVHVPYHQYLNQALDKSGDELFQMFYAPPILSAPT